MPYHESPLKQIKQDKKRHLRNVTIMTGIRRRVKKIESALANGKLEDAKKLFPQVNAFIYQAAHKNVIHKKTAARKVSRLNRLINQAEAKQKQT